MGSLNCWEFKKCGREPGGSRTAELGLCPAAVNPAFYAVHGGKNGGRACWVATSGVVDGDVCPECRECEFFQLVRREEGESFRPPGEILARLRVA